MSKKNSRQRKTQAPNKVASHSKHVRSILALAAGASVLPLANTVDASVVVDSSLSGTVIGWNTGAGQKNSITNNLSGGVGGFTFKTRANAQGSGSANSRVGCKIAWAGIGTGVFSKGGYGPNPANLVGAGQAGNFGLNAGTANINIGFLSGFGSAFNQGNAGFSTPSKYLNFKFNNSGTINYGWIEIKSMTTGFSGGKSAYTTTLGNIAYENSGIQINAGQLSVTPVPEPSTASLAMAGALVAGAAGLRRWSKERAARQSAE